MVAGVCPCTEISGNFLFYDTIATCLLPKGWVIIILVVSRTSSVMGWPTRLSSYSLVPMPFLKLSCKGNLPLALVPAPCLVTECTTRGHNFLTEDVPMVEIYRHK